MTRVGAPLVLALVLLAGCFAGNAPKDPAVNATAPTVMVQKDRPEPVFNNVTVGATAQPDLNATLAAPPKLIRGEWWRVQLESPLTGDKQQFIRVLAQADGDNYVFGMPHEGWWKEAVLYHTPAFGDVSAADLSYKVHDVLFTPLKFPLTDGQTWQTKWEGGADITASVKTEGDKIAHVTFVNPSGGGFLPNPTGGQPQTVLELTYDASQHEVVEFKHPTVTFKVVEHGYDFQGWVTVPRAEKLVFFHGRVAQGLDANGQPNPSPLEQVEIKGGYNRLSYILNVGNIVAPAPTCKESAVSPSGKESVLELTPCNGFEIKFFEYANPDGVWNLTHIAPAGSIAFIEGIAYHQYDVRLPDGAIRTDHSHPVIR
jgi:hypothetical protein